MRYPLFLYGVAGAEIDSALCVGDPSAVHRRKTSLLVSDATGLSTRLVMEVDWQCKSHPGGTMLTVSRP